MNLSVDLGRLWLAENFSEIAKQGHTMPIL